MSGTAEFQMLRDGEKCLLRLAVSYTEERQARGPGTPSEKRQESQLVVNDGQCVWMEGRRAGSDVADVRKQGNPGDGLKVRGRSMALLAGAYTARGLKGETEELSKRMDVKLGGKGSVAGRPTTVIELSSRAARPQDPDEQVRGTRPARSVCELDDATGVALAVKDLNWVGDVVMSIAATEAKANTGLDKKLFTYTPPEGVKVEDRTQAPEKSAVPKPEQEK